MAFLAIMYSVCELNTYLSNHLISFCIDMFYQIHFSTLKIIAHLSIKSNITDHSF